MKNKFPLLNSQRVLALVFIAMALLLLNSLKSDVESGPIVKNQYPSYDLAYEQKTPKEKYGKAFNVESESVYPGDDPEMDVLPNEKRSASFSYDLMLVESVISIIQGYYVDNHRVSNQDIYGHSLDVLKEVIPDYKQEHKYIYFSENNKRYRIRDYSSKNLPYSEMIRQLGSHHKLAQKIMASRGSDDELVVIKGILQKLDAHSALLMPEDYEELKQGTEGVFGGLGVLVGMRNELLTVIRPIPNSPAQKVGVTKNDKILSINGHKTYGSSLDQLIDHMRGAPGTKVDLELLKANAPAPRRVTIKREVIQVDSVTSKSVNYKNQEYLYMAIDSFASRTTSEIKIAMKKFRSSHGGKIPGVILDLRSNPGGLLDQAVTVADLFVNEGVLVSTRGRKNEIEKATVSSRETDFPMVVLINGESASASEIVAGALQDHGRALVVGQQSFGKGSVQTVFELPGQRAIKLTIARYYTPKGRTIQNEGITPDVLFQPVYEKDHNENLLGDYRYRGEGTLSHALSSKSILRENNSRAIYHAFYMADENDSYEFTDSSDREFELAKVFLNKVINHYGESIPKQFRRVNHQLYVTSGDLNRYLDNESEQVFDYLKREYEVSWGGSKHNSNGLSVQLINDERIPVIPGKKAFIPLRIFNESSQPVNNVSVFFHTDQIGLMSREILIGSVPANSSVAKKVSFDIPTYWQEDIVVGKVGIAVNGKPTLKTSPFEIDVKPRVAARLSAFVKLVKEKGGKLLGKLEPNEKAMIKVEIKNSSDAPANATDVRILNLAGNQIKISKDKKGNVSIPAKGKKIVYFNIYGSNRIYNDSLNVGLYLDSSDMVQPYRKEMLIKAEPGNTRQAKFKEGLYSH